MMTRLRFVLIVPLVLSLASCSWNPRLLQPHEAALYVWSGYTFAIMHTAAARRAGITDPGQRRVAVALTAVLMVWLAAAYTERARAFLERNGTYTGTVDADTLRVVEPSELPRSERLRFDQIMVLFLAAILTVQAVVDAANVDFGGGGD